ncbi:uncharacterized protein EV420DRAFT_1571484, partial [Desarmillaria tabescens]
MYLSTISTSAQVPGRFTKRTDKQFFAKSNQDLSTDLQVSTDRLVPVDVIDLQTFDWVLEWSEIRPFIVTLLLPHGTLSLIATPTSNPSPPTSTSNPHPSIHYA